MIFKLKAQGVKLKATTNRQLSTIMQTTSKVLMIRPLHFVYNAETAVNNSFQVKGDQENLTEKAVQEFDAFVSVLMDHGIDVTVVEDSPDPHTPDAIFPNNWISFHSSGIYCLFPMFAPNRRKERKAEVISIIQKNFHYAHLIDFTGYESENLFWKAQAVWFWIAKTDSPTRVCLREPAKSFCRISVINYITARLCFMQSTKQDRLFITPMS